MPDLTERNDFVSRRRKAIFRKSSLGNKSRSGNFKKALARMVEIGALEYTLPKTPRSKRQQYRLTGKGRRLLKIHGR